MTNSHSVRYTKEEMSSTTPARFVDRYSLLHKEVEAYLAKPKEAKSRYAAKALVKKCLQASRDAMFADASIYTPDGLCAFGVLAARVRDDA